MDLILTNKEVLVRDEKIRDKLGCRDLEMVIRVLRGWNGTNSGTTALEFWRADCKPFRDLLGKIPWKTVLERRGVQESCCIFKDHLLQAQEWSIPKGRNEAKRAGGLHG